MNRRFVVDASVAIKLCIAEADSERALALIKSSLSGNLLLVPDLVYIECANILWKHVQRRKYPEAQARRDMQELLRLQLAATSTASLANDALEVANALKLTAYDACYVALAAKEAAVLVTADEKLIRKLEGTSHLTLILSALTDADLS